MIATGNDLTGWTTSDPCGCTVTALDPMALKLEVRVCYDCRRERDAKRAANAARRAIKRTKKARRYESRKRSR